MQNNFFIFVLICQAKKNADLEAKKTSDFQKVRTLENLEKYPKKKIEIVRRKLTGGHPCQIIIDELGHGKTYAETVMGEVRFVLV